MTTQGAGGPLSPLLRMDAARACLMGGNVMVAVRRPAHDVPVEYLAAIRDGDYACWKYYDFDLAQVDRLVCKTWDSNLAARMEIRLDSPEGKLIGICDLRPQSETAYAIHECAIQPVKGKHALYFVFKAANPAEIKSDLLNLEWFTFLTSPDSGKNNTNP